MAQKNDKYTYRVTCSEEDAEYVDRDWILVQGSCTP